MNFWYYGIRGDTADWPLQLDLGSEDDYYTPSSEVLSFGCIACHVITQKWLRSHVTDPWGKSDSDESFSIAMEGAMILLSLSLATFKEYIHQIGERPIKQLMISCVMHEQKKRPSMTVVHKSITDIVTSKCLANVHAYEYCLIIIVNGWLS